MSVVHGWLWRARLAAANASLTHLRSLRRWARADHERVSTWQRERLAALLRHAHDHVPYYRGLLEDHGVVVGERVDLDRYASLPLLDKSTIRDRFESLRSDEAHTRKTYVNTSGGSTGEPVRFVQDDVYHAWNTAAKLMMDEWAGARPGDRVVVLWGAKRDLVEGRGSTRARIGAWLRNELQLNAFRMDADRMRAYLEQYNRFRPALLLAYAQSLYQWARFIEGAGLEVVSPRTIMTSATTLDASMRACIERVFQAPVHDRYGSREVGGIACENGDGQGLVVMAPTQYVEVLTPDGSACGVGGVGEIVVTSLTNLSMPLLRYRIGDAGILGPAPVGAIAWPRLAEVAGRVTDIFYTAQGDQVYGGFFTQLFYHRPWIEQFQVVQEAYDHIRVRVVLAHDRRPDGSTMAAVEEIRARIRKVMGASCRVDFDFVDTIAPTSTGKRRYTISELGPPAQGADAGATDVEPRNERASRAAMEDTKQPIREPS